MKIRIVKASSPNYWYAGKIGEVMNVKHIFESGYGISSIGKVEKEDAEEVIEHNSQLYRKVDRPVREGDTIIITSMDHAEVNEIRTIVEINEGEMLYTLDSPINGEDLFDYEDDYDKGVVVELIDSVALEPSTPAYAEVSELIHEAAETAEQRQRLDRVREGFIESAVKASFAKVAEINGAALQRLADSDKEDIVEHNGKQYRKVKRKAAVDDLIIVTNKRGGEYREGEVLTVIEALYEHEADAFPGVLSKEYPEYDSWLYHNEYETLEPIESTPTLTEVDIIANLAQEVAELKKRLPDARGTNARIGDLDNRTKVLAGQINKLKGAIIDAQTDIADLEDRLDENEKDVEEVIGRINEVNDAVVSVEVIEKVIVELRELEGHAEKLCDHYEDNGIKELAQFQDGKSHAFLDAQKLLKEALRNG